MPGYNQESTEDFPDHRYSMVTWIDPVSLGMKESLLRNSYGSYTRGSLKAFYSRPSSDAWSPINVKRIISNLAKLGYTGGDILQPA